MSKMKLALDVVSDLRSLAGSIETLVQSMEEGGPKEINEPEKETKKKSKQTSKAKSTPKEKQPTLEEVRAMMADKSRDGHREAVKAIITKYGASNLSSLDPKHYAAALKEAGELK